MEEDLSHTFGKSLLTSSMKPKRITTSGRRCGSKTNTFEFGRSASIRTNVPHFIATARRTSGRASIRVSGFQRFPDGTAQAFDFTLGETVFSEISADDPMIHDLENTDDHLVRFVAIELKDL